MDYLHIYFLFFSNLDLVDNLYEVWCRGAGFFLLKNLLSSQTWFSHLKLSLGKTDLVLDRTGGFWVLAPLTHLPSATKTGLTKVKTFEDFFHS